MSIPEDLGAQMVGAVREYVGRALAPVVQRMATVETRLAAATMILARGPSTEKELRELETHLQIQRDLIARIDRQAITLESLERRLSRHAEHLARLESRMKKAAEGK